MTYLSTRLLTAFLIVASVGYAAQKSDNEVCAARLAILNALKADGKLYEPKAYIPASFSDDGFRFNSGLKLPWEIEGRWVAGLSPEGAPAEPMVHPYLVISVHYDNDISNWFYRRPTKYEVYLLDPLTGRISSIKSKGETQNFLIANELAPLNERTLTLLKGLTFGDPQLRTGNTETGLATD